jgi:hypothetical protein
MPRRRVLTSAQISELLALPTDEPTLIRHYTLSDTDLAVIQRRRRPAHLARLAANRLYQAQPAPAGGRRYRTAVLFRE